MRSPARSGGRRRSTPIPRSCARTTESALPGFRDRPPMQSPPSGFQAYLTAADVLVFTIFQGSGAAKNFTGSLFIDWLGP